MKISTFFLVIFALGHISLTSHADMSDRNPTLGGVEFERSCAICHGFNAKGKGVMAKTLTKQPADLTKLTKMNNGHFPFTNVYKTIEGSLSVGVHGTREMPVWGARYRKEAREYNELAEKYHEITQQDAINEYLYSRGLILDLIVYIISIQEQ